ncbi:hypothetical protein CBR_g4740 [Chara braunii]|uniref:Uncharacterized protein n=1 Tax=Chara braunii TaxID=69332 RepID=A0A388KIW8_CHABU|nr:hypothetical protein CBR_g4740 [Chara braunii]|eukprot:GBG69913.1 hypothetical protein CBR_g4740 [Chara braunii]
MHSELEWSVGWSHPEQRNEISSGPPGAAGRMKIILCLALVAVMMLAVMGAAKLSEMTVKFWAGRSKSTFMKMVVLMLAIAMRRRLMGAKILDTDWILQAESPALLIRR